VDLSCQSTLAVELLYNEAVMALATGHKIMNTCCQLCPVVTEAVVKLRT
jgi:hypothetical protein